ncbi:MAG: hydrogenase maturation protease [Gemmatimonadales bacterium]|nr:hydrogenase maturation protease [Gemmatimonadales bacterium]
MTGPDPAHQVVVVGLGNPILRDDAVGVLAARVLAERLAGAPVEVRESSWGGIRFLDLLAGFARAIIIDAIEWRHGPPGTVYRLSPDRAIPTLRAAGYHDISLGSALDFGRAVGLPLPGEIVFFAVEASDTRTFDERPTPAVEDAVPEVVSRVEAQLVQWGVIEEAACTKPA